MNRAQLEHAIRAACDVADDDEVYVLSSQAILGEHPTPHHELTFSMEVDIAPKNKPDASDRIDGSLGERSLFHDTHGFYVDGLSIESAKLPTGWETRCIRVRNPNTNGKTGWCLACHDLAASKLAAFREKDRDFVRVLLRERLIETRTLQARLQTTTIESELRDQIGTWVEATTAELGLG